MYTQAIQLNPYVTAYWANRAFAYIKTEVCAVGVCRAWKAEAGQAIVSSRNMQAYGYALIDASKAIELDPAFVKGYYRRATANMALNHFKNSLRDLKEVCMLCVGSRSV